MANLPANEHEAGAGAKTLPRRARERKRDGNLTAKGVREDYARYYLNHPGGSWNIVSNDSPPFWARPRINTIVNVDFLPYLYRCQT